MLDSLGLTDTKVLGYVSTDCISTIY